MNLNRTTSAPESATTPTEKPKRRRVVHFYWVDDMAFSDDTGVPIPSLCKAVWRSMGSAEEDDMVDLVAGLMVVLEPQDCRRCLRVLEARQRRVRRR